MSRRRVELIASALAVFGGLAVARMDASPGFDDTGITAGLLALVAFGAALLSGRRPWLFAAVTGLWVPIAELQRSGNWATFLALVPAGLGAGLGWILGRWAWPER